MIRNFATVLLIGMIIPAAACSAGPDDAKAPAARPPVGFEAMERLDLLPCFLPPGTQTRHVGNYDIDGGNDSGFRRWIRGQHTNGDWIIFDEVGPGCLYRQQMNVWHGKPPIDPKARIRYWFDGEQEPRLDMTFEELFGKDQKYTAPFTPPLVFFDLFEKGGRISNDRFGICYYPFPFEKRLTITMTPQPLVGAKWFQYTLLKFPAGTAVETWKGPEVDSPVTCQRWNNTGRDPKDTSGNQTVERTMKGLAPGARETLLELGEAGSITGIHITFAPVSEDTVGKVRLVITWDDADRPAVDVPLGAFVGVSALDTIGYVWKKNAYRALMQGYDGPAGTLYSYWPMPFWSKARIEVINDAAEPLASLAFRATWKPASVRGYPRETTGHFHVLVRKETSTPASYYSTIAYVRNRRGRIVGQFFHNRGYHMDGDEFTYFDGSMTPWVHGSGSEDEHNQGYGGSAYDKPLWGGLKSGFSSGYRFYLNESYLFDRECRMTYEHHGRLRDVYSEGVIYAYLDPGGRAFRRLTDTVDVGSPESETAHAFAITDETWNGTVHSCYDVYEGNKTHFKVSDEGRACTGEMRFRVAIDPDNRGVVLRRRVDRRRANMQEADVVVDGAVVPQPWHFRELPAVPGTVWYDSEFAVPAGLTAGKKQLDIVVRHRASDHPVLWEPAMQAALPVKFDPRKDKAARGINAFQFWVFTLGPTTVEEPPEMPHALSAGPVEKDGMRLRWASHDDTVQSYTVERRGVTEPAFSEVAGVGADERSVTVSGLAPGTFYEFRVRARNRVGESLPATLLVRTEGDLNAANPLRKAKASASSVWESKTGGSASAANDGDMDTRWNSAQGRIEDQWLAFDLAEPVRLCGLLIYQETSWTTISAYRIQVMVDGDWKDVYHGRDMPDVALCRFPPVTTGGVRIWIDSTTGNTPTIKEVAAFGAPGEPKQ